MAEKTLQTEIKDARNSTEYVLDHVSAETTTYHSTEEFTDFHERDDEALELLTQFKST